MCELLGAVFLLLRVDGSDNGGHQIIECAARRQGAAAEGVGIDLLFGAGQQQTFRISHREVQCDLGGSGGGSGNWYEVASRSSLEGRHCTSGGGQLCGREGKEDGEGQKRYSSFHNHLSAFLRQDSGGS